MVGDVDPPLREDSHHLDLDPRTRRAAVGPDKIARPHIAQLVAAFLPGAGGYPRSGQASAQH